MGCLVSGLRGVIGWERGNLTKAKMNSKPRRMKETMREKIILAVGHGDGAGRLFCEGVLAFVGSR